MKAQRGASRIKMGGNALPAAGEGPVELQPVHSDSPCRFQKPFRTSSVWSTEFNRFSCTQLHSVYTPPNGGNPSMQNEFPITILSLTIWL